MSSQSPITRRAPFVLPAGQDVTDLVRSTPRQSFASEQAKRMMGAGNPLSGKETRAVASVYCSSCHRWHRPGTPCPNSLKAMDPEVMLTKGNVVITKPKRGNPYHDSATGRFAGTPGDKGKGGAGDGVPASQDEKSAAPTSHAQQPAPQQPQPAPEPAAPPQQQQAAQQPTWQPGTSFGQGMSAGQSIGQGMATPGGTMAPTITTLRQTPGLLQQPQTQPQSAPSWREQQQALETQSQQLQTQQQGYVDRLRQWLAQYVGGGR